MAQNLDVVLRLRDEATGKLGNVNQQMKAVGTQMAVVGAAGTAAFGLAAKGAASFEAEMTKVVTLVGVNRDQVDEWADDIKNLAKRTGRGPQELAEALFVVTSAGIKGADALDLLESAAKASAVGLGETKDIARVVTAAVQAYGAENLDAALATDILMATVREGNLEASELAGSLGKVIGIAAEVGATFEDVGSFVATFTRLGVSAAEAVTSLKGVLALLIKPTEEAKEGMAELGLTFEDLRNDIAERGLDQALIGLIQRFDGNVEALGKVIPNVEALAGVLGTASAQGVEFAQISENINNALGIVDEGFITTKETAQQQFAEMKAAFDVLVISIGEDVLPIMKEGIGIITVMVGTFDKLPDPIRRVASQLGLAASGLTLFLGGFLILLPTLVQGVTTFKQLAVSSRLFRLSLLGFGVAAAVATVAIIALDKESRSFFKQALLDVGELEARAIVNIFDVLGLGRAGNFSDAIEDIDRVRGLTEEYGQTLGLVTSNTQAVLQATEEWGRELEADPAVVAQAKVQGLIKTYAELVDVYGFSTSASGAANEAFLEVVSGAGLSNASLEALAGGIELAVDGFSTVPGVIRQDMLPALDEAQEEFKELGLEVPKALTPLQTIMAETSSRLVGNLEEMGEAFDDLLPKAGQTFEEWRAEAEEFATAFENFETNLSGIFNQLQQGNVEMLDEITVAVASRGPVYTQQIAEFFRDNPTATLETFQAIAPTLASDWVGVATRIIIQQGPEYRRALDEAVINNIENVPKAWRTEFTTTGEVRVKQTAANVKAAIDRVPNSKHIVFTADTSSLDTFEIQCLLKFIPAAHGFHGPTLFMAGEGGGSEKVDISPVGSSAGGGGATVIFAAGAFEGAFPSFINTASPDDLVEAGEIIGDIVRERMQSA